MARLHGGAITVQAPASFSRGILKALQVMDLFAKRHLLHAIASAISCQPRNFMILGTDLIWRSKAICR